MARLGQPWFLSGRNARAAWALTPAPAPALLLVHFDHPGDTLAYRDATGQWRTASVRTDSLRVNTQAGVVHRRFRFVHTADGLVVRRRGDTAWVAPVGAHAEGHRLHALGLATSLEAFRSLAEAGPLPGWSVVFAGAGGAIARVDEHGRVEANPAQGWLRSGAHTQTVAPWLHEDTVLSAAALERAVFETQVPAANGELARLVDEWERIGGTNPRRAFALDTAIELLRAWDRRFTPAAVAATLYAEWREEFARPSYREGGFGAFRALEEVSARLRREHGTLPPWGERQRLQRRKAGEAFSDSAASLPLGAAPAWADALFAVTARRGGAGRRYAVAGRAWTAVTELADTVRSRTVTPFGPRPDTALGRGTDQAEWFAAARLKEASFGAEAGAHARERYHPGQRARVLRR